MNRTLNILKCLLLLVMVGAFIVPSATAIVVDFSNMNPNVAGKTANFSVGFTLESTQGLVADGKIKVVFPVNETFDISAANIKEYPSIGDGADKNYTLVIDVPKRELVLVRDGTQQDYPQGTWIQFTLGNIVNSQKAGTKPVDVYTTVSNDVVVEQGSGTLLISPDTATHFTLGTIANQVAGMPFTVTVTALDQFENVDTAFSNYSAVLTSTIGAIEPPTMDDGNWIDGVWTGSEVITKTGTGTITATSGSITRTSNQFTVNPGVLDSIVIQNIASPKYDGLPFTVTARAYDEFGNFKTDYNGNDTLGTIQTPLDSRPIPITPEYAQFANGIFSKAVTIDVIDPNVPQPTYYGAKIKIATPACLTSPVAAGATVPDVCGISNQSNPFNVSELPVDLVNSTVAADPLIVPEDGVSVSTITVTVKNGITQGAYPDVVVSLTSDRGESVDYIATIGGITDSEGKARFTISSSTKGTANLTARVKGYYTLNQKAKVYFGYDKKLHLLKDWNLVSIPWQLANSAISALSTTKVDRIYYYDAASSPKVWKYAIYDRVNETWSGTLTTIDDGKGYWMFASAPDDVPINLKPVEGGGMLPAYPLNAGWNMIGYTQKDQEPYLYTFNYIWPDLYYQSDMWKPMWNVMYEWTGSEYKAQYPLGVESQRVVITKGYWIFLKDEATLVP